MSKILDAMEIRGRKTEFKVTMVLAFILVAISFFAVGFIYANVPQTEILLTLIIFLGGVNAALAYYLCKKFDILSGT